MKKLAVLSVLFLVACTHLAPNQRLGNDLNYLSLRDKRDAERQVQMVQPGVGRVVGQVSSERCHGSLFEDAPEEKTLIMDLKAEAYRLGANGLRDVQIQKDTALGQGCWHILKATANMVATGE